MTDAPFRRPCYAHQLREFEQHRDSCARALLWQMRSGKTKACIDLACHLYEAGRIDGVLVLAPNGVHADWAGRAMEDHAWERVPWRSHAWRTSHRLLPAARRATHMPELKALLRDTKNLCLLAVNSEALDPGREELARVVRLFLKGRRVLLIADEADDFRTPGSTRSCYARAIAKKCAYVRILSGTVSANTPLATWGPFELLQPRALGCPTYTDFEARYAVYGDERAGNKIYRKVVGYQNLDELQMRIAEWSSVVLRSDCPDLPDLIPLRRDVDLTAEAAAAYQGMRRGLIVDLLKDNFVTLERASVRVIKLQQCLSGWTVDDLGNVVDLGSGPRLDAMLEEVRRFDGKTVVWCQFREDIRRVVAALTKARIKSVQYHGAVDDAGRADAKKCFREEGDVRVLVGQPQAGGRGQDFSAADQVLWYSHTTDLIVRDQASERATAMGKRGVAVVDLAVPDTRDTWILDLLATKRSLSDELTGEGLRRLRESLEAERDAG